MVIRIFIITMLLLLIPAVLVIETTPAVTASSSAQINQADTVNPLLSQINQALKDRHQHHTIDVTEPQFDSIVGMVQRGVPAFRGDVSMTPDSGFVDFTLALAGERLFLNLSFQILPGDALKIEQVSIGDLSIPGEGFLHMAELAVNFWTDSDIATQALTRIRRVEFAHHQARIELAPLDQLLSQLNTLNLGFSSDQDNELKELTAHYLRYISGRELALSRESQPLLDYMREGFARARELSQQGDPVLQNKATILALAVFIGHHRVANLVGDIQPDPERALKPRRPAVLREREDLARHFIISAAIKVLSQEELSLAIGEFKELMDRAMGGSGYSFVDLAADMAGVRFARVATSPQFARDLQNAVIYASDEAVIMPAIDGLPEGLSKQSFEQRFGGVDTPAYQKQVDHINARLKAITLYQSLPD